MKKRADGRYRITRVIDGVSKDFYSSESTEKKARQDIDRQMMAFKLELHRKKHNFKVLADEVLADKEITTGFKTVECYKIALNHMHEFFDLDIEDVTPIMAQRLLESMGKQKYSKSAMSKVKTMLGLILNHAIMKGAEINNFARVLRIPKTQKKQIKSPDDLVIESITQNVSTTDFGLWALVLLCTGLRPGEVNALQRNDIDFKNRVIYVEKSVEFIGNQPHLKQVPKTEEGIRCVPLLDILYEPLYEHCQDLNRNIFVFGGDKPYTKTMLRKRWKSYCQAIGHTFTQYQLRHAYAKILYEAGVDPKTAQGLLGHADFGTTMNIYTEFSKEMDKKAVEKLNGFMVKIGS